MNTETPNVQKPSEESNHSKSQLKEIKYDLREMIAEVAEERFASSMARQIINQDEIQKMLEDRKKKLKKQGAS